MRTIRIIPCLDVDEGRVVKGVRFLDLVDAGDPSKLARAYDEEGADELVFLDITASSGNREIILDVVERTASQVFIPLTVGGGIRTVEDARKILRNGADKVAINSQAVARPALISEIAGEFGSQCVVVAIDAKHVLNGSGDISDQNSWEVYVKGGRVPTAIDVLKWATECQERGAGELLITSMDRDGTKAGYDIDLMREISSLVTVPIIASGGVGEPEDFLIGAREGKADGLLAASVFHFGECSISQVKKYLLDNEIMVRL